MQRSGFRRAFPLLLIFLLVLAACDPVTYKDEDMAPLTTLSRTLLNVVKASLTGQSLPAEIGEDEIRAIVAARGRAMPALAQLDRFDMRIVSNGKRLAAVIWDPKSGRKLIEDLRCTSQVDTKAWRQEVYGSDLTLDWGLCPQAGL